MIFHNTYSFCLSVVRNSLHVCMSLCHVSLALLTLQNPEYSDVILAHIVSLIVKKGFDTIKIWGPDLCESWYSIPVIVVLNRLNSSWFCRHWYEYCCWSPDNVFMYSVPAPAPVWSLQSAQCWFQNRNIQRFKVLFRLVCFEVHVLLSSAIISGSVSQSNRNDVLGWWPLMGSTGR